MCHKPTNRDSIKCTLAGKIGQLKKKTTGKTQSERTNPNGMPRKQRCEISEKIARF
jgi:hypothetical protein